MPQKKFVQNAVPAVQLNLVLSPLKFLLNWAGKISYSSDADALDVIISGTTLTSSVCSLAL